MSTRFSHRPPQRTDTHRIDTLAVRKLLTKLSDNWIIRDLSERDYGIDLMLEYYDDNNPTGQIIFYQVKGKRSKIEIANEAIAYSIKKKTLLYAELFPEPFLLIHTSIDPDEAIYYVWLQKYISNELDRKNPDWRSNKSKSITIKIPESNRLHEAEDRLISISASNIIKSMSLRFLSTYLFWDFSFSDLSAGNADLICECRKYIDEFKDLSLVFNKYNNGIIPDFKDISDSLEIYDMHDEDSRNIVIEFNETLENIKSHILTKQHQEYFLADSHGENPY